MDCSTSFQKHGDSGSEGEGVTTRVTLALAELGKVFPFYLPHHISWLSLGSTYVLNTCHHP